ncbi:MAG: UDP-glucose 6-dehydrogenase, partial [Deltaproteobacteria bacterium]|nr:UDP-glucose 6-dehydrogenase [Deltaproteobacteria bacterium]
DKSAVLVLCTEWNQFRRLDLEKVKELMVEPNMVDLRNIYKPEKMKAMGFNYISVGR